MTGKVDEVLQNVMKKMKYEIPIYTRLVAFLNEIVNHFSMSFLSILLSLSNKIVDSYSYSLPEDGRRTSLETLPNKVSKFRDCMS